MCVHFYTRCINSAKGMTTPDNLFWGCTHGGVYLNAPCIYSHDMWVVFWVIIIKSHSCWWSHTSTLGLVLFPISPEGVVKNLTTHVMHFETRLEFRISFFSIAVAWQENTSSSICLVLNERIQNNFFWYQKLTKVNKKAVDIYQFRHVFETHTTDTREMQAR